MVSYRIHRAPNREASSSLHSSNFLEVLILSNALGPQLCVDCWDMECVARGLRFPGELSGTFKFSVLEKTFVQNGRIASKSPVVSVVHNDAFIFLGCMSSVNTKNSF
jgi:hypothetical protein